MRVVGTTGASSTEGARDILFRQAGTLSNLYVKISANSNNTIASTLQLRKNVTNSNQVISVGTSATGNFEDTTHTDAVVSGDKFTLSVTAGNALTLTVKLISLLFDATTDTVTKLATNDFAFATASTTTFAALSATDQNTTEANVKCRMRKAGTLKNMACYVRVARATACTARIRKNGANGNLNVSLTAATTGYFEDTSSSDTVGVGEDWNYSLTTGTGVDTLNVSIGTDFISTANYGILLVATDVSVTVADATNRFFIVGGLVLAITTEAGAAGADMKARAVFTCSELTCLITANGVTAASTCTLRKNAADTTLSASITASTTGVFSDSSDIISLVATDLIDYNVTAPSVAGTPTITIANILMWTRQAANIVRSLSTETVTVGESIARTNAKKRPLSTETVTATGTVARVLAKKRSLATETVSKAEAIARSLAKKRTLSESVTISEAVARKKGKVKALATEIISIGESVVRSLGKQRTRSESVTVGESVTRQKAVIRAAGVFYFLTFDGVNQYIDLGNHATLWSQALTNFSVGCWIYPLSTPAADEYFMSHGGTSNHSKRFIHKSSGKVEITIKNSLGTNVAATSNLALPNNTWSFVYGTYDNSLGSANLKLYINAVLQTDQEPLTDAVNISAPMALGSNTAVTNAADCNIRDFTFFATATLTQAEIAKIMNNDPTAPTPDYWLKTTEGGGNPVDAIGGKTTTLTNGAGWGSTTTEIITINDLVARVKSKVKALATETVSIGEAIVRSLGKKRTLSETVVITEQVVKSKGRPRAPPAETVTVGESITRSLGKKRPLATESTTATGTVSRVKGTRRALTTEIITIGESIVRRVTKSRSLPETVSIGESAIRKKTTSRALATESTTATGTVARVKGTSRALATQIITIGEAITRSLGKKRTLIETVIIGELINRIAGSPRALATEIVSIGESVTRSLGKKRTLIENVIIGESVVRRVGKVRVLIQTVIIADLVTRSKVIARALGLESVTVTGTVTRLKGLGRALSTEIISIADNVTKQKTTGERQRFLDETVPVGESITRSKGTNRTLIENITSGESITRALTKVRSLIETVIIGGTATRSKGTSRSLSTEIISIGDNISRSVGKIRVLIQSTIVGESISRSLGKKRTLSESTTATGTVARSKGTSRSLSTEIISIGSTVTRQLIKVRSLIETVIIGENVQREKTGERQRNISETVNVGESVNRSLGKHRSLSTEIISIGESISRTIGKARSLIENVNIASNVTRSLGKKRSLPESVPVGESTSRSVGKKRTLSDSVTISEAVTRVKGKIKTLATEIVSIADQVTRRNTKVRALTESTPIASNVTRSAGKHRSLSDSVIITGTVQKVKGVVKNISETVIVAEFVVRSMTKNRAISQLVSLADNVARVVSGESHNMERSIIETVNVSDFVSRIKGVHRALGEVVGGILWDFNKPDLGYLPDLICAYLKQNWVITNPAQNDVNWCTWYSGVDDVSIHCGNFIELPRPVTLPWYRFDYDGYIDINVFVTDIKGNDAEPRMQNIRSYIETLINGNPNGLDPQGVDMIKIDTMISRDYYDETYKNDVFRLTIRLQLKMQKQF